MSNNHDGIWHLKVASPMGTQEMQFDLRSEGDVLSGTMKNLGNGKTSDIFEGVAKGDELSWKMKIEAFKLTLTFVVTVDGDSLTGKVKTGGFGSFKVTGERA